MAHPASSGRKSPVPVPTHQVRNPSSDTQSRKTTFIIDQVESVSPQATPVNTYPCGCPYPGTHFPDCMWSLWDQMNTNYLQTKTLMSKFMAQVNAIQTPEQGQQCACPPGCHGRDLGEAMGLQQMSGVTVPWGQPSHQVQQPQLQVESETRKQMEEQQRIKNTWAQFLNVFDMALDLANDVSKDRWEANRRRKEREQLERQERLEGRRRERRERCSEQAEEKPQEGTKVETKEDSKKGGKTKTSTDKTPRESVKEPPEEESETEEKNPSVDMLEETNPVLETPTEEPVDEGIPT